MAAAGPGHFEVTRKYEDFDGKEIIKKEVIRTFKRGDDFCIYRRRSSRRGYLIDGYEMRTWQSIRPIRRTKKTPGEIWEKSWRRAADLLAASGLWPDILADIKTGLDIGYDKIQAARAADCLEKNDGRTYEQLQAARAAAVAAIDSRLNGNTWFLWHMAGPAKIKAMYFGKYQQAGAKEQIIRALVTGTPCRVSGRASYDISFEYVPAGQDREGKGTPGTIACAWYSEEYKGCGNGHYYLALNGASALFYEDD